MLSYVPREIDDAFDVLETAFIMRKQLTEVYTSQDHIQSINAIVLKNVEELCELLRNIQKVKPAPSEPEIMAYLKRMLEVKINLNTKTALSQYVDWAKFYEAMSAAFKSIQG